MIKNIFLCLSLCLFVSISCQAQTAENNPADVERGVQLFKKGRFQQSFDLLKTYADKGNPRAQFTIGLLYDMGGIRLMDKTLAVKWYKKAADQGLADAQYDMGVMLSKGEGIYKNLEEARQWYEKAATQNHGYALFNLGVIYERGYGVPVDLNKAEKWYQQAIQQNIPKAAFNLGHIYYQKKDAASLKRAFKLYQKAAELNHSGAQYYLGWMYEKGEASKVNITKALFWYKEAAINGHQKGMWNYVLLLKKEGNSEEAAYWEERIKRLGKLD